MVRLVGHSHNTKLTKTLRSVKIVDHIQDRLNLILVNLGVLCQNHNCMIVIEQNPLKRLVTINPLSAACCNWSIVDLYAKTQTYVLCALHNL